MKRFALYILLLCIPCVAFAQFSGKLRFNHYTTEDGLSQNTILAIAQDKYGYMWFGTWEGISRFDGYSFHHFRANQDDSTSLSNNRINAIICDSVGNIWVATGDQYYFNLYNYETGNFKRIKTTDAPQSVSYSLNHYAEARNKAYNKNYRWQAYNNGLVETNKRTNNRYIYKYLGNQIPFGLSDNNINVVYLDKDQNLWVGTQNGGINVASLKSKPFNYWPIVNKDLNNLAIRAICQDKEGHIWIGTESDGIIIMNRDRNPENYTIIDATLLINPEIRSIYIDHQDFVWIGTKGGLDRYNPKTKEFRHYYAGQEGSINHHWVFSIIEDHQNTLWVSTFGGISKYNRKTNQFASFDGDSLLPCNKTRILMEDTNHNLWVGTEGYGLVKLSRQDCLGMDEFVSSSHYKYKFGNTNSLINDYILALAEDKNGNIWIGNNSGLCRLNPQTEEFKRFSVANGFPDDLIMGILANETDQIWVSHKKGITCININSNTYKTYNQYDGLLGKEFKNTYYQNKLSGEMFWGSIDGFSSFYPQQIKVDSLISSPVLTRLKIMNEEVHPGQELNKHIILSKSIHHTKELSLRWNEANFSIQFSALNFKNPKGCLYRYKLENMDQQWIYTDALNREANYTYIPHGHYEFKVYAANSDGIWSKTPASINIEILPPWWLSWWAKLSYLFITALILWFIYKFVKTRIHYQNKLLKEQLKNEKNEELINMKMKFFTEISHEFRTPLTLIIDPLKQLISGKNDTNRIQYLYQIMDKNANHLLELINQLLDFRKLQGKTLPLKRINTDLVAFIEKEASIFEFKAKEKQIQFLIHAEEDQINVSFDPDRMKIILNNLLGNAFKFTSLYGQISIHLSLSKTIANTLKIEVKDNGKGIPEEHLPHIFDPFYQVNDNEASSCGSGIGMALTKELVQLHGGTIEVNSTVGQGTCFTIYLPLSKKAIETVTPANTVLNTTASEHINVSNETELNLKEELPLILVVDDNEDIREYIRFNLQNQYRVITASDGNKGFNKAVEHIPDLVISDIMMPGIDGYELCKRLKKDEFTSHIPVILLTAKQAEDSQLKGYQTGVDDYITKPFNKEMLETRILNLLIQRQKLRELFSKSDTLNKENVEVNVTDEIYFSKAKSIIEEHMADPSFNTDILAEKLKMSRSQLYRKMKAITNRTASEIIKNERMNKARILLLKGELTISEIGYQVGYPTATNFSRTFSSHFGLSPSKYLQKHQK